MSAVSTSAIVSLANQQGTQWTYDALGQLTKSEVATPATYIAEVRQVGGKPYIAAVQFLHAAYLHATLAYPIKKAHALATAYVKNNGDKLSSLYTGDVKSQCVAINEMHALAVANYKDNELERALITLEKAQARVQSLQASTRSKALAS
jgi:hypothetical protein